MPMGHVDSDEIPSAVRDTYRQIAISEAGGCCAASDATCAPETPVQIGSRQLGYSEADRTSVPDGADLPWLRQSRSLRCDEGG